MFSCLFNCFNKCYSRAEESEYKLLVDSSTSSIKYVCKHKITRIPSEFLSDNSMFVIFSFLNGTELSASSAVNKKWKAISKKYDNILWKTIIIRDWAFGKRKWAKYIGEIGEEPPLPEDIYEILTSPCPVFPRKKVGETHVLTLIPEKVDQQPLTMSRLNELVRTPKEGHKTTVVNCCSNEKFAQEHVHVNKTCWVLMIKNILAKSRKLYGHVDTKQHALKDDKVKDSSKRANGKYQMPKAIELAVCISMKYIETKERLFDDKFRYIYCLKRIGMFRVPIGGYRSDLIFLYPGKDYVTYGIVPL